MRTTAPALLPIFRSEHQAGLLAWCYLRPGEEFTLAELARRLDMSAGTLHAEVERLERSSLLVTRREGRNRLVSANESSRLFRPLAELLMLTYGPQTVIAEEFAELGHTDCVAIYGSWARRYRGQMGKEPGDIDVMVIGKPMRDEAYEAAIRSEERLGISVSVTVRSHKAWREGTDPLVLTARKDAVVVLQRHEDDDRIERHHRLEPVT